MNKKVSALLKQGEGLNIEYKECKNKLPKSSFDTICSFLNRNGGHIMFGVADNGDVIGVEKSSVEQIKKILLPLLITR